MKTILCFFITSLISAGSDSDYSSEAKNLRPLFEKYNITVKDQGNRGTCSVFAIVGVLEFEYAHRLNQNIPLSVEYLNWASNKITGEIVDGSFFNNAVAGMKKYGICSDEYFPYYATNYSKKVEPSEAAIRDAAGRKIGEIIWIKEWDPNKGMTGEQLTMVKEQIDEEHPVAIGFLWPKKDEKYRKLVDGMMYIPDREGVFDGHSIIIVGYQDDPNAPGGGFFIFKNSHGEDYAEQGYGKMPYGYVLKYANDGVVINIK